MSSAAETTPEREVLAARAALADKDLFSAAAHVGLALASDPDRPEWLALLDSIVLAGAADPDLIAPLDNRPFFATVAVRGYVFGHRGDVTMGLVLLIRTFAAEPSAPFVRWALPWLAAPGALEKVDFEAVTAACVAVLQRFPGDNLDNQQRARLGELVRVLDALGETSAPIQWIRSMALRKVGRLPDAIHAGRLAFDREPSFSTAIALAYAHRQNGDVPAARAAFESAMALDPNNLEAPADLALMLCGHPGSLEEGLSLFDGILAKNPRHHCARPASLYYRALLAGGGLEYDRLEALAREHPADEEIGEWLSRAHRLWLHPRVEPVVHEGFIDNIAAAIEHITAHDPDLTRFGAVTHRYQLAAPLSEERVAAIEREAGITLPADYRAFLTRVASAGAGPGYGLLPLDSPSQLASLSAPFPHLRPHVPDTSAMREEKRAAFEGDAAVTGTVALAHMGCCYFALLVVTGPRAGSIWADLRSAGLGLVPTHDTFTEWYGLWVRACAEAQDPPIPVPPGRCAPQSALGAHLEQWQSRTGIQGQLDEPQLRECLGAIGEGGISIRAEPSRYFDKGDPVDPCPICTGMFHHFFRMGAMSPAQIKKGVPPRCARG